MCHQSVGLVARHLEAAGIPTVVVAILRAPSLRLRTPRTLLVSGARGRTAGEPGDRAGQVATVRAALALLAADVEPGAIEVLPSA
jgi:D-proline reductase (dithiol) PrdB